MLAAGQPLAGARVQAYLQGADDGTGQTPWRRVSKGTTGADGTVRLPAAPGFYLLSASAQGHAPARREVDRPSGEAETVVELSLPAGVELRGRVITAGRGEPMPLADVSLHPYAQAVRAGVEAVTLPEESAAATSDPQGRFTFSGLAPGRYALTAQAPGFSQRSMRVVTVPSTGELEVTLWASSFLEGFVLGEDGKPAAGAEVMALGGRTSAVRAGLVIAPGQRPTVDFQLDGTAAVEGHVTNMEGQPIAGAYVQAQRMRGAAGLTRSMRTDATGAYRLEGLETGTRWCRRGVSRRSTGRRSPRR